MPISVPSILTALAFLHQVESQINFLGQITDWSSTSYDQLHDYAVRNQVHSYQPLYKYIQPGGFRSLNGLYKFCLDPSRKGFEGDGWFAKDLNETTCNKENFYKMPVPSAFNDITSNSRIKNHIGWVWYQTTFVLQSSDLSYNLSIRFENVNYMAAVWIQNIHLFDDPIFLGAHVGGYLPFAFKLPRGTKFRLTIAASNILTNDTIPSGKIIDLSKQVGQNFYKFQPDFDFFHFAGIMGDVMLSKQNLKLYIEKTEKINRSGTIFTKFTICLNEDKQSDMEYLHMKVRYGKTGCGSIIYSESWAMLPGECIKTPRPQFFEAYNQSELLSIVTMKFGLDKEDFSEVPIRFHVDYSSNTIETNSNKQLASIPYYLQGFGMHQEQLFSGRTMSLSSIVKDLYLLKESGANVIRTSHYPYSPEYLEACDELGIKVIAECQAVGLESFSEIKLILHKQLLLEMMQRDDHHPSIIMWSVANEPRSDLLESKGYFESLLSYARRDLAKYTVDSGRPLTAAIAQSHEDDRIGHTLDVIMVNRYYGWYDYTGVIEAIRLPLITSLEGWSKRYPTKGLIVSEFGADTISGLHSITRGDIFTEEYQRDLLVEYEKVFDEISTNYSDEINFLGSMIWNFADFSTHDSLLRVGGNRKGIFNRDRSPKLAVEAIKRIYLNRLNKSSLYEISEGAFCGP